MGEEEFVVEECRRQCAGGGKRLGGERQGDERDKGGARIVCGEQRVIAEVHRGTNRDRGRGRKTRHREGGGSRGTIQEDRSSTCGGTRSSSCGGARMRSVTVCPYAAPRDKTIRPPPTLLTQQETA